MVTAETKVAVLGPHLAVHPHEESQGRSRAPHTSADNTLEMLPLSALLARWLLEPNLAEEDGHCCRKPQHEGRHRSLRKIESDTPNWF